MLRVVSPVELEYHRETAKRLFTLPEKARDMFWEDRLRLNPSVSYMSIFANPNNLVLDFGGVGILAFMKHDLQMRANLFGVNWGRHKKSKHVHRLAQRLACKAALEALEVHTIEAITRADNTPARRAMEYAGFTYRGKLKHGLCYNGVEREGAWYELTRADVGLEPIE